MACLTHSCFDCGHVWFDNNPSHRCPMCGSFSTSQLFDEICDDVDTPEYTREYEEQEDDGATELG